MIVRFVPRPCVDGGVVVQIAELPNFFPDTSISVGKGKENGHLYRPRSFPSEAPLIEGVELAGDVGDVGDGGGIPSYSACIEGEGRIKGVIIYSGCRSLANEGRSPLVTSIGDVGCEKDILSDVVDLEERGLAEDEGEVGVGFPSRRVQMVVL